MIFTALLTAFAILQGGSDNFGYTLDSVSVTSGSSLVSAGLLSTNTSDDIAQVTLSNDSSHLSTSAAANATYTITWSPSYTGQTPPSTITVCVGRSYKLTATGNGTCTLTNAASVVLDSITGSDTFINGQIGLEAEQSYSLSMTTQPDGTATATLVVPTNSLASTFDSTNSAATSTTEYLHISSIDIP